MSLKDELLKSNKIDFNLQKQVLLSDGKDDERLFTVFLKASKPLMLEKQPENGIVIRSNIGDKIYTADVSLEGLSKLDRDERVVSIQAGRKLGTI